MSKDIELPRRVVVGEEALLRLPEILDALKLDPKVSVCVSGEVTRKVAGEKVASLLETELIIATNSNAEKLVERLQRHEELDCILAVGGGRIIDLVKLASWKLNLPYISCPTSISHDGIASPQAVIKRGVSIRVKPPLAVVADTEVIRSSPRRLTAAGCGDVISNYTAVLDWELAHREIGEEFGDYAASLAKMSAEIVIKNAERISEEVEILIEALISSGTAMSIAGSSRPCSGAEHMFSHALDELCPRPALHGEQCGVGSIMMAYLHGADWEMLRESLEAAKAPVNAKQLGIEEKYVIDALLHAPKVRKRYTILRNEISLQEAVGVAKATGVIG